MNNNQFPLFSQKINQENFKEKDKGENEIMANNDKFLQYISKLKNNWNDNKEINEALLEEDGTDNLMLKNMLSNNQNNQNNVFKTQRFDSCGSEPMFKSNKDIANMPDQKLEQFLNNDLLNELDLNNNLQGNNRKMPMPNESIPNNKNLYCMPLFSYNNPNNNYKKNKKRNTNEFNEFLNSNNNIPNGNSINNKNNSYNYNNLPNYNLINYNNINYNINNPNIYIHSKLKNIGENNNQDRAQNFQLFSYPNLNEENNYNNQLENFNINLKKKPKTGKKSKKHFEVREGDWTCLKCYNLNFAFRVNCNRCGLPKDYYDKNECMNNQNFFNQNLNYPIINTINSNNQMINYPFMNNNLNNNFVSA